MLERSQERRAHLIWIGLLVAIALIAVASGVSAQQRVGQETGLPLPRFVSLSASQANVRSGPGETYPIVWTYVRHGYPVEITQEFDVWRRIRDIGGEEGWIRSSFLSSDRMGVVRGGDDDAPVPIRASPSLTAGVVAQLEQGVLASVNECRNGWCRLIESRFNGWIEQDLLWGVYPDETF